jgi:hypothetical protein
MSSPESPTVSGLSNWARIPASLTSRHNPLMGEPAVTKSTWMPTAIRGSRYTNLRILCKALVPAGPTRVLLNRHTTTNDPLYVSAQSGYLFKESTSSMNSALQVPSLSMQSGVFRPSPWPHRWPYRWTAPKPATGADETRCSE